MKGIVLYKGKYGATQQYANWIGEELQLPVIPADEVSNAKLSLYDFVIVASSVYMGKWLLCDWLERQLGILENKKLFLFIVCAIPASEMEKRAKIRNTNFPRALTAQAEIFFLPGRLMINKLSWSDKLFLKIGTILEKDPVRKNAMKHDMDAVSKKMLIEPIKRITAFLREKSRSSFSRFRMMGEK